MDIILECPCHQSCATPKGLWRSALSCLRLNHFRKMMVRGTAFRIATFAILVGAAAMYCVSAYNELSAQIAEDDAQRHHDSLYHVNTKEWKYVHSKRADQENRLACIHACSEDSPLVVAMLQVFLDVESDNPKVSPGIMVTLIDDSLTNSKVKLQWNDHSEQLHRITFAREDGRTQRSMFFLDPYEAMLDSITHCDSLTLQCLTHKHHPATFRFLLPKLEMEGGKMIEHKE